MPDNVKDFLYDLFRLEGKNAVITGGSQGIGEDLTRTLALAGANVALANRNVEKGEAMARWVREQGRNGRHYPCDVTDKTAVEQMAAAVENDMGPVDILVNCAGINRLKNALDFSEEEVVDIIHTNLLGVFWCCQAVGTVRKIPVVPPMQAASTAGIESWTILRVRIFRICRIFIVGLPPLLARIRMHSVARSLSVGLAVTALVVSGCTSLGEYLRNGFKVGPNYATPPAPVAENWIDANRDTILNSLADLVRIRTENIPPSGNEKPGQEYLYNLASGFIPDHDVDLFLIDEVEGIRSHPLFFPTVDGKERSYEDRPNLVVKLNGSGNGPSLLFSGHIDTAMVNEKEWNVSLAALP